MASNKAGGAVNLLLTGLTDLRPEALSEASHPRPDELPIALQARNAPEQSGCAGVWVVRRRFVMALSAKLTMRQGQSMVLTPQLLQAIKLLQMPNAELAAFVEEELERNPLLERADDAAPEPRYDASDAAPSLEAAEPAPGDWASENLAADPGALAKELGTEIDNAFDPDRAETPAERPDRKSTRLNSSHVQPTRMPSSA